MNCIYSVSYTHLGGADNVINSAFNGLIDMCFNSENYIASNFGSTVVDFSELKALILSLAISLIVLKFLKKGFDIDVYKRQEQELNFLIYLKKNKK